MAANTIPAPSSQDNWVLISSVTPTLAASTVSFTGISGYRKLMLRPVTLTLQSSGAGATVTFNSDTGTNYAYAQVTGTSTIANSQTQIETKINITTGTGTAIKGMTLIIDNTNTAGIKTFAGFGDVVSPTVASFNGVYIASAAITTVTLTAATTFAASGTVALYGVAA